MAQVILYGFRPRSYRVGDEEAKIAATNEYRRVCKTLGVQSGYLDRRSRKEVEQLLAEHGLTRSVDICEYGVWRAE